MRCLLLWSRKTYSWIQNCSSLATATLFRGYLHVVTLLSTQLAYENEGVFRIRSKYFTPIWSYVDLRPRAALRSRWVHSTTLYLHRIYLVTGSDKMCSGTMVPLHIVPAQRCFKNSHSIKSCSQQSTLLQRGKIIKFNWEPPNFIRQMSKLVSASHECKAFSI